MKTSIKRYLTIDNLIFLAIILIAVFFRFYNFSQRAVFGPEQAISLITSGDMVKNKISLLGQENVQRITSEGHIIFSGALFNYTLIPLQLIFDYKLLPITAYFALLNVFTGVVLYLVVKRMHSKNVALLSMLLFLLNPLMIYHSLFIWILNYLPLIGILLFYLLKLFKNMQKKMYVFLLGLLCGIGLSLEYAFVIFLPIILFYVWKYDKKNFLKNFLIMFLSVLIPNAPLIIFDIRHNFYHLYTLWVYLKDALASKTPSMLQYYDFLPVVPLISLFLAQVLNHYLGKKSQLFMSLMLVTVLILFTPIIKLTSSTGNTDFTIENIQKAAETISAETDPNINVAVINDFDTRGHILRYFLTYIYDKKIMGVEDYPKAKVLYVLAPSDYNFKTTSVWELTSPRLFNEYLVEHIGSRFAVFKLYN